MRHVFGYPGGQLTPIYDALYREPAIRHVLARDEQAAAFMADGYARATGRPGVCLAVCGPGVLNAATPLATAFTDSVPVLLISGQVPTPAAACAPATTTRTTSSPPAPPFTKAQVPRRGTCADSSRQLDRAWAALTEGRPGPVLFEVPLDVLRAEAPTVPWPPLPRRLRRSAADPQDIEALARLAARAGGSRCSWRAAASSRRGPSDCCCNWPSGSAPRCSTRRWASAPCRPTTRWRPACPGAGPRPT